MPRRATPNDQSEILNLLECAFAPSLYESTLVALLHQRNKALHEWVVPNDNRIVGYIAYTHAYHDRRKIGYHLAPVAVHPSFQSKGIGSQLIENSLSYFKKVNAPVFVLGDTAFYQRFGFVSVNSPTCPFDPDNEHFMALNWQEGRPFSIGYEEEFTEV